MSAPSLSTLLKSLKKHYGQPKPPVSRDPLELVLWENVAYMANDEKRAQAFALLKKTVGLKAKQILAADHEKLVAVGRFGIVPFQSAKKLVRIAEIAHFIFHDDLRAAITGDVKSATKALRRFPSIGEPGAEKILLFAHAHKTFALDSNGMRVLHRYGLGEEKRQYAQTYRSVQQAVAGQLPAGFEPLIAAHLLLRQHGKELCKTTRPLCQICPVVNQCRYGQDAARHNPV